MFEKLILSIIHILSGVTERIKEVYYDSDAFADKDLSLEFELEVDERKVVNREFYIQQTAIFIGKKTLKEKGYIMPPQQAVAIAEDMFNTAKQMGQIDELNNIIIE